MITKIVPYLELMRPINAAMTCIAVALGFWIGGAPLPPVFLLHLLGAACCAVGFGNTVNDIVDIEGDRINHPARPLPRNELSIHQAKLFALLLAAASCGLALSISTPHLLAASVPLLLLLLYARFLKPTLFAGNILVSFLVAYPLIYGGLGSTILSHLLIPAALAFLLNFCREIVKDIQDRKGDRATGAKTTAQIGIGPLNMILTILGLTYLIALWLPYALGHFGRIYLLFCATLVLPLHTAWLIIVFKARKERRWGTVSLILKLEMLSGLAALGVDRLFIPPA
ncbi:MAG: hypothetical protein GF344_14905 [Chitinivibrionales bacterium]|nr:hypothetical protein [Chitinivibrionales bacterium]MBD3357997.1 hypothetical protein [Chitinivibrionales bacterium]